ncbi:MAG TPA: hypothetical protein VFS21_27425 [Roseiflexaceae bacterium]|nr:hypothetical protein [Roseiflexaceae bacterium]
MTWRRSASSSPSARACSSALGAGLPQLLGLLLDLLPALDLLALQRLDSRPLGLGLHLVGLDGGPVAGRLKALRVALAHWRVHCDLIQQEGEAPYPELLELRRQGRYAPAPAR